MLYQEVRPETLEEMVGNKAVIKALSQAVKNPIHSHVYMIDGPSGCGKTTLARILSAAFGCKAGMGLIEINAAESRGIDTVRQLELYTSTPPFGDDGGVGKRAIILDEAHMLTKEAANALLKMLEDVPAYQYWFLCTTEPQKIIKTIQTRCDRITVKLLSAEEIGEVVDKACKKLNWPPLPDDVLFAIEDAAEGCARQALVLLERCHGLAKADQLAVINKYQTVEKDTFNLCQAVIRGNWYEARDVLLSLREQDNDWEGVRRHILGYLRGCLAKERDLHRCRSIAQAIQYLAVPTYDSGEPGLWSNVFLAIETLKR